MHNQSAEIFNKRDSVHTSTRLPSIKFLMLFFSQNGVVCCTVIYNHSLQVNGICQCEETS